MAMTLRVNGLLYKVVLNDLRRPVGVVGSGICQSLWKSRVYPKILTKLKFAEKRLSNFFLKLWENNKHQKS